MDEFLQIAENGPTFTDAGNDGGEAIVEQDHISSILRDIRPDDSHGDSDVGFLKGERIIHPVTGHRDDLSLALQERRHPELFRRSDAGENDILFQQFRERLIGHARNGRSIDHDFFRSGSKKADLACDGKCGLLIVPRHHHDTDTVLTASEKSFLRTGPWRIDHRHHPDPCQLSLHLIDICRFRKTIEIAICEREDAQRLRRKLIINRLHRSPILGRERPTPLRCHPVSRKPEHDIRGTLHVRRGDPVPIRHAHAHPFRRERKFGNLMVPSFKESLIRIVLPRRDQNGAFGRISQNRIYPLLRNQARAVAQGSDTKQHFPARKFGRIDRFSVQGKLSLRCIPHTAHLIGRRTEHDLRHRQLVLRDGSRLIGTDDGNRTERFHGRKLLRQHVVFQQSPHPQGEGDRYGGRQSLRNHRNGQCESEQKALIQ